MFAKCALITLSLLVAACGPPPGMPPSPVNPPVKPPPPQTTVDDEVVGADGQSPADLLAQTAKVVVTPGEDPPARVEPASGWAIDESGVSYSIERQQRLVQGQSAEPPRAGSGQLNSGVPVSAPALQRPQPARTTSIGNPAR